MSTFIQEIRYAGRMLAKTPAATLVAVITLALGIGANTAIFSVVYAAMFRPLPFAEPDRLMHFGIQWKSGYVNDNVTIALADTIMQRSGSFQSFAMTFPSTGCNLSGSGSPEFVPDRRVNAGFFRTLGVAPALGRDFLEADAVDSNAILISYPLWRSHFGADPGVLGKTVWCNGVARTVVGVLPQNFRFLKPVDVWLPDRLAAHLKDGGGMNYLLIGRLAPNATRASAAAELTGVFQQFKTAKPGNFVAKALGVGMRTYREWSSSELRTPLWVLFGSVLVVLLIACANVTGLLLARSAVRRREMAVRVALGARRWDIIRQMLTETLLLNLVGGVIGVVLALWFLGALKSIIPAHASLFSFDELDLAAISINAPVLWFTAGVVMIAALLSGVAPALSSIARDVYATLKSGERGGGFTHAQQRSRKLLLAAEVALAIVLLACATLLIRSFVALQAVDLGFNPRGLQVAEISMSSKKFAASGAIWSFDQKVLDRFRAIPGVVSVATASSAPLQPGLNLGSPVINGKDCGIGAVDYRAVSSDYFRTMGIHIVSGRDFADSDAPGSTPVVIVNRAVAQACWNAQNPVGAQFWTWEVSVNKSPLQVVGIADDVREYAVNLPAPPVIYVPQAQASDDLNGDLYQSFGLLSAILIRTSGSPDLSVAVRRAVEAVDPQQPIVSVAPMSEVVGQSTAFARMLMLLMAAFAGLALLLTAIGLYGLLSYHVAQRTREIGVRMALGAGAGQVLGMVVREGMMLVVSGAIVGIGGAMAATRLLKSQIYGVSPGDPLTLVAAIAVLFVVGVLASYLPARRATRVHPMEALRYE